MNRRTLLNALVAALAIPLAPIRLAHAAQRSGRRLILVELSGANDGLNTVVPIKDERYREIRPKFNGSNLGGKVNWLKYNWGIHHFHKYEFYYN
jgi:uncharacterized protein (DUF1501 family)